jgi:hypothetical protein
MVAQQNQTQFRIFPVGLGKLTTIPGIQEEDRIRVEVVYQVAEVCREVEVAHQVVEVHQGEVLLQTQT